MTDSPKPEALLFTQVTLPTPPRSSCPPRRGAQSQNQRGRSPPSAPRGSRLSTASPASWAPGPTSLGDCCLVAPLRGEDQPLRLRSLPSPSFGGCHPADSTSSALPRLWCQAPIPHPGRWWSPAAKYAEPAPLKEPFIPSPTSLQ